MEALMPLLTLAKNNLLDSQSLWLPSDMFVLMVSVNE